MAYNRTGPSTPFEWLSGGLFFGKKSEKPNEIDSCKDVVSLLNGVNESVTNLYPRRSDATVHQDPKIPKQKTSEKEESEKFLSARLRRLRFLLYDERRQTPQSESNSRSSKALVASKIAESLTGSSTNKTKGDDLTRLIPTLLHNLVQLPFESRKDVSAIFSYLLLCGLDGADAEHFQLCMADFREYVDRNFDEIMSCLVQNHDSSSAALDLDVVLHSGTMFRSCIKHLSLYEKLVSTPDNVERLVFPFLDNYVHSPNFDCASDAMATLKLILTGGVEASSDGDIDLNVQNTRSLIVAAFLERDYEAIWDQRFNSKLLSSDESNYLIRRMALQILSTVLLTRTNYKIMVRYIDSKNNLILVMLLLRDKSPHITLDAFHVFKIFVANPNKPPEIIKILSDNKIKLCNYLEGLHKDKEAKEAQFRDEKALVISTIEAL
jgi:calcium binding protein 39